MGDLTPIEYYENYIQQERGLMEQK